MNDNRTHTYDGQTVRWLLPDPAEQFHNPYLAMGNNPVMYVDPDGEFITWSINNGGFSIGFNLTPIGIPLGGGVNIGWSNGGSAGIYGEVGYRVGGNGLGTGATVSQSLDYGFRSSNWSTNTSAGGYASFGPLTIGGNLSSNYDMRSKSRTTGWSVYGGFGIGLENGRGGLGLTIGYGSGGLTYGLGGNYYMNQENIPRARTVSWDEYVTEGLPDILQCGPNDCIFAALEAVDASFGYGAEQAFIKEVMLGFDGNGMIGDVRAIGGYNKFRGLNAEMRIKGDISISEINQSMRDGQRVIITRSFEGESTGHSMTLKSVSQKVVTRSNGMVVHKNQYRFQAMDPFVGKTIPISNYTIISSHNAFFLFR